MSRLSLLQPYLPYILNFSKFLTIVNLKSNFIYATLLTKQSDTEIVKVLSAFFQYTSVSPSFFHSDNATNLLKSSKVRDFLFSKGVKTLKLSIPFYSRSAAHCELANGILKYTLKRLKAVFTSQQ